MARREASSRYCLLPCLKLANELRKRLVEGINLDVHGAYFHMPSVNRATTNDRSSTP